MELNSASNMVCSTVVVNAITDAVVVDGLAVAILPRHLALVQGGLLLHAVVVNVVLNLMESGSNGVKDTE
jgi:hypothetical protein